MTASTRAWMLDVAAGWRIAVGSRYVIEYLLSPEAATVPLAPSHCRGMLVWHERLIPLVDLRPLLDTAQTVWREPRHALILGYRDSPQQPVRYGALVVRAAPTDTSVSDDMACPLPEEPAVIRHLCRSCFVHGDEIIPILDTARLFSQPLPLVLSDPADEDVVHCNEIAEQDGSALTVAGFANGAVNAAVNSLSVSRSASTSPLSRRNEPAWQAVAQSSTNVIAGAGVMPTDYPAAAPHTPAIAADAMDGSDGKSPASTDVPGDVGVSIAKSETNTHEALNANGTAAAVNGEVDPGLGGSALHVAQVGTERPFAKPAPSMVRAEPLTSTSPKHRSSAFRDSLERFNALGQPPSSRVSRRAGYAAVAVLVLAGALYGGLAWRSQLQHAVEISRQAPARQDVSPRPAPVSVPSAPMQPPK
jgi:chemotaxis signal transduction protein